MKYSLLCLSVFISAGVNASPIVDTFETVQTNAGEVAGVAGAISTVRHLGDLNGGVTNQFGVPGVNGTTFSCAAGTVFNDTALCRITYDNVNDGSSDINNGTLGTGSAGGGIDFVNGSNTELTIEVSAFDGDSSGSLGFSARNYSGTQCTSSVVVTGVGTYEIPFSGGSCTGAALPTDVRGFFISTNAQSTTPGAFIEISMPEATPVELESFSVE